MTRKHLYLATAAAAMTGTIALAAPPATKSAPPAQPAAKRMMNENSRPDLRRVSKLMGMDVRGTDNEKLGDIKNLAINANTGRASFALVSTGGVAGIGDKLRFVPFTALQFNASDEASLDTTRNAFDAIPTVDDNAWNRLGDPDYATSIYRGFNMEPDRAINTRTGITRDTPPGRDGQPSPQRYLQASKVIGQNVENASKENLGDINDLVVNVHDGQVAYAVLGFGGWLGINEKLFAVPWHALSVDPSQRFIVLNVDKSKLKNAPGFDKNNWPDFNDLHWNNDVHAFYGTQPDWIYGYSDANASDKADGWQSGSEYNRLFKSGSNQKISGTITDVDHVKPMNGMDRGVQLTIQTAQGQTANVQLGPAWFIEHQIVQFNKGDAVTVSGAQCTINNQPVILATEVRRDNGSLMLRQADGTPAWDVSRLSGVKNAAQ